MDALDLFMARYDAVHIGFVDELFQGLSDEQLRQRPRGVNSIAWLVWHLARVQDAGVSRFVGDRPQVLDEGDWNRRMGIDRRDVGPGMRGEDVEALSATIDVPALRDYHRAVAERAKAIAASLAPAAWTEVVPAARVRRAVAEDRMLLDAGRRVEDFWVANRSRAWFLLQVGLLHPYGHCFDGMVTRGLLGVAET